MALRVGMDLADIAAVREALADHGERYLERVYTPEERAESGADARQLALCFAAKEATMKAIGRSDEALSWRSIEVRLGGARPAVRLHGPAREIARRGGVGALSMSYSRTRRSACAIVIAEVRG